MLKLTSPWIVCCVLIEWDVKSYALKNRTFDIEYVERRTDGCGLARPFHSHAHMVQEKD